MTELRKIVFEKRSLNSALIGAAASFLEKPIDEHSWKEIEDMRAELATIRKRTSDYINEVEDVLCENAEWKGQWDLAMELYTPYNEPYNPDEIDQKALEAEFVEKGLNEILAAQIAASIKHPIDN